MEKKWFLYSDKADITKENLMELIYVGKKYQVHSLINKCNYFIEQTLDIENACYFLEASHTYFEPGLHRTVLELIEDNFDDVYWCSTFNVLCRECLGEVLELNEMPCYVGEKDVLGRTTGMPRTWENWGTGSQPQLGEEEVNGENDRRDRRSRSRSRSPNRSGTNRSRSRSLDEVSHPEIEDLQDRNVRDEDRAQEAADNLQEENYPQGAAQEPVDDLQDGQDSDEALGDHEIKLVNVERQLFNILLSWTDSECRKQNLQPTGENRRLIAGDLITKIRFGFLDSDFVICRVSESGLLTTEQECTLMKYLLRPQINKKIFWKDGSRELHSSAILFPRFERKSKRNVVTCKGLQAISVQCFEDLYFHGFTVFKKAHNVQDSLYCVSASITDESRQSLSFVKSGYSDLWRVEDEEVMCPNASRIVFRRKCTKTILLDRKILLKKNCKYNILAKILGPDSYCGTFFSWRDQFKDSFPIMHCPEGGNSRKVAEIIDYEPRSVDPKYEGGSNARSGQIADLVLSFVQ